MPFVQVASCEAALATAERLGGAVLKERTAVPRVAWQGVVADPAGNRFLVWESDPLAFPPPEPDGGTRDGDASAFGGSVRHGLGGIATR
jgi:hypothetical protein